MIELFRVVRLSGVQVVYTLTVSCHVLRTFEMLTMSKTEAFNFFTLNQMKTAADSYRPTHGMLRGGKALFLYVFLSSWLARLQLTEYTFP